MDSNHRCLGVGQESLPLDHGTIFVLNAYDEATAPDGRLAFSIQAEAVGLEPTIRAKANTCFRDRPLIRPDDFRKLTS